MRAEVFARQNGMCAGYRLEELVAASVGLDGNSVMVNGDGSLSCLGLAEEDDHIIPLAWGGSDALDNHQGLCHDCHRRKTLDEQRGRGVRAT